MTTLPPLVGLIGRQRSGKDTFAATLVEEFRYRRVAFADPLRQAAYALDPLVGPCALPGDLVAKYRRLSYVVDAIGWESAKDTVPEVRATLQRLGTNAIRALDEDFWVRAGMATVAEHRATVRRWPSGEFYMPGRPVVVTDVRFPNEAEAVRRAGGVLVRVVRPGADGGGHATETALDDYPEDFLVDNDGTLEDLATEARTVASLV